MDVSVYVREADEIQAVHYDFGKHERFARPDASTKWWLLLYIHENFYMPSLAMVKLSILLFYARIFPGRTFRRVLYAIGGMVLLWWTCCQFVIVFQCRPIPDFWKYREGPAGPGVNCIDVSSFFVGQAIPNIATDIVLLILPLPSIWRLQLPVSQRLSLVAIFAVGSL